MPPQITNNLKTFITQAQHIYSTGKSTEHSYRKALQELLESLHAGLQALNEPKRQSVGAPDFIIFRNELQIAFLEAKDIVERLDDKKHKNQIERYQALGNLCFTNNLDWQFFHGKEMVGKVSIGEIGNNGKIKLFEDKLELLASYLLEFVNRQSITIKNSRGLAEIMAQKAKSMRETLVAILIQDEKIGQKSELYNEYETFKKILIHDLTISQFSDIYAQTIGYGLFTARYYDQSLNSFSRHEAASNLPKSNPFLRKLFQTIAGYDLDPRLSWVVDNLVEVFVHTDVRELMHNFGVKLNLDDPVLHFYETFLGEYDPTTRKARGVYYTPDPVVKFMVKSVDEILQEEFDLPMGLADNSKIQRKISKEESQNKLNAKIIGTGKGQKHVEEFHKVQILDPATGTGTFLLEVFNQIYNKFKNNQGIWQSYAQNDLLPRVHGFEILMASYTMVHLKLAMFLTEKNVEIKDRLSVYLTNSLEEGIPNDGSLFSLTKWLTDEAEDASKIKNEAPVMVVIGNPPYSVSSSNSGKWITNLVNSYKKDLNERNIQPLSDDYIKFIRYGQHFIEKNGEGILAYISNNSFIDGIIHRMMRESLMQTFDKIYILDLHGNSKKKETTPDGGKDENVFDIQQGVSINIFVKSGKKAETDLARVHHHNLYGKRKDKYEFLLNNSVSTVNWTELKPDEKYHFFVPKNFDEQLEWEKGIKVSELFVENSSGVTTGKDERFVSWEKFTTENNFKYEYKYLDFRFINYEKDSLGRARYKVMKNYILGKNISLNLMKSNLNVDNFSRVMVCNSIVDKNFYGFQTYTFPLYLYPENNGDLMENEKPRPNFNPEIIKQIEEKLQMKLDWDAEIGVSYLETKVEEFTPTDLLDYIYGVLHSPSYREKYKEFLKIDFPRIPFDADWLKNSPFSKGVANQRFDGVSACFWMSVETGSKLRKLHLLENINMDKLTASYNISGNNLVEKIRFEKENEAVKDNGFERIANGLDFWDYPGGLFLGKVYINDTQYFDNVPEVAWNFFIGGYQPAQKWLKDRKGRELTFDDIIHYQKIIYVLTETARLMREIDQ